MSHSAAEGAVNFSQRSLQSKSIEEGDIECLFFSSPKDIRFISFSILRVSRDLKFDLKNDASGLSDVLTGDSSGSQPPLRLYCCQ